MSGKTQASSHFPREESPLKRPG